jgi:hypothetical protein
VLAITLLVNYPYTCGKMWTLATYVLLVGSQIVTGQLRVDGDTVIVDPRLVHRLSFGSCDFNVADYSGVALQACFADGTILYLGTAELHLDGTSGITMRDTATQTVLWRCLTGGQCLVGNHIPLGIEAFPVGSVTVTGKTTTRIIGPWITAAETRWHQLVLQRVCLAGGAGVCGTRIGQADDETATAVVLLSTGQVVVDNGVSAAFIQASLAHYTVITKEIVRAAEDVTTAQPVVVARAPVTGETGVLTCTVFTAPSTCGRFRWRQTRSQVVPTMAVVAAADYAGIAAILDPDNSISADYFKLTSTCRDIGATNADELPFKLCQDAACATVLDTAVLHLDLCVTVPLGFVRCFCTDAT